MFIVPVLAKVLIGIDKVLICLANTRILIFLSNYRYSTRMPSPTTPA